MNRARHTLVIATLALLALPVRAEAAPVQDFNARFPEVRSNGSFSLLLQSRISDSSGGVPPAVVDQIMRLPAGAKLRREFLVSRFSCDVAKLTQTRDPATCKHAQVGSGRLIVDLRPFFAESVPFSLHLFLAKASQPGAVASVAVLAVPDPNSQAARSSQAVRDMNVVLGGNIYDDPRGPYGYRIDLPSLVDAPVLVSVVDFQITITGLSTRARASVCVKRKKGRCAKKKVKMTSLFWLSPPTCPKSRKLSFENTFIYTRGQTATKTASLGCPRFKR